MNKLINTFAIGAFALLAVSCQDDGPEQGKTTPFKPIELTAQTRAAVDAGNDFSLDFFKTTVADKNSVVSPYSVFSVLSMLANADDGAARKEILTQFGYSDEAAGLKALNDYCCIMNATMPTLDGRVTMKMTNTLWTKDTPTNSFLSCLTENFKGEWLNEDPRGNDGMEAINRYVAKNTSNMISKFIDNPLDTDLILLNTVYFNGKWKNQFDAKLTKKDRFENLNGGAGYADYMKTEGSFNTLISEDVIAMDLPYGSGNFSMTLLMPSDAKSFTTFRNSLTMSKVNDIIADMNVGGFSVYLPKFQFNQKDEIIENLREMGFNDIFEDGFNNLLSDKTQYLTTMLHGTSIEVNEEGTKAASATMAGGITSAYGSNIKFDSPFIFLIRETSTNSILFAGQVTNF